MIDQINLPPAHYGADIRFRYFSKTSGLYYNRTLAAYEAYDAANHAAYLIATNENPAGKFTANAPNRSHHAGGNRRPAVRRWHAG
jgi:hypothetical protein